MKEDLTQPTKICTSFSVDSKGHRCVALKDDAFVKYVKRGQCGTVQCPFFKPGGPGEGRNIIRKENDRGHVWFEPYKRKENNLW